MKFSEELVDDLADKLLIGLSREENKMVLDEFSEIDKQIDLINAIPNIDEVSPMTHCLDEFIFELREDEAEEGTSTSALLANCDDHNGQEISIPKVVG